MTSLEVIKDVMNVPMAAVHAIARMNGISTADNHAKIISEEELLPFVEAFERKTRNYFVNSMRNCAQLNPEELQTFTEFCKTFKKGNVSLAKVSSWSHIGKTKLRQYFVDQIKEKTPSSVTHHAKFDLFSGIGGMCGLMVEAIENVEIEPLSNAIERILYLRCCNWNYDSKCRTFEYHRHPSRRLLSKITSDWRYHAKTEKAVTYSEVVQNIFSKIVLSARYYVYIDDDDDHHTDTVIINGHNDPIINSTYRMVV